MLKVMNDIHLLNVSNYDLQSKMLNKYCLIRFSWESPSSSQELKMLYKKFDLQINIENIQLARRYRGN